MGSLVVHVASEKDNIVKLTKFNFESNVKQGHWFVKFYAPWCTHCQRLAPIWEKLADQAAAAEWPVKIADVDCTTSKEICEKVQVKAFPMLTLISDGVVKGKYKGEASASNFEEWLNKQDALSTKGTSASASGQQIVGGETESAGPTTSHFTAGVAILSNFVTRFPTTSKILNIYIMGGTVLAMLVVGLCTVFKMLDAEDESHDKHN